MKMKRIVIHSVTLAGLLAAGTGLPAAAQEPPGPLPSQSREPVASQEPARSDGGAPATALPRETAIENALNRTRSLGGSAFGGYGELTLNDPGNGPAVVDMRRLVLYFGHDFSDDIRFYSEVEVEHAVSSADDEGEVEVEQAYLDGLVSRSFNLRGGVILMPVGIVNVYHEPPSFNGVDRPDVDQFVIPSTWREPGVGIFGELAEGLRYQLYLVNGFNANGFTAESAIREGHQEAQLAHAGDFGVVGRVDYEPMLGTVFGVSAYTATSGNTLAGAVGSVLVTLFEIDARTRRGAFSARAELAFLFIGDAAALSTALAGGTDEQQEAGPIASRSQGAYVEVAYDLFHLIRPTWEQSLTVFGRFDYADTQADVPDGFDPRLELRRTGILGGLVWRPIPQVAIKADLRRHFYGAGDDVNEAAGAITWLF